MKTTYKTSRKYKCPYCDIKLQREQLVDHVSNKHEEMIPEGYTAARAVYDSINGKNYGTCMICKSKVYRWNDKIDKYYNLCDNPKCREEVRRIALERHMKVYNKPTLLNDPEQQEKMLASRKISGTYTFSDGGKFTYTGQYERKALEFIDKILEIPSKDIQAPGPVLEYQYGGETHKWITDIFYIPANLLIEVKDGGSNPNKRVMTSYREKQIAKETMVTNLGTFNYIRLTNNDFAQLLDILADMKYEAIDADTNNRAAVAKFHINESMDIMNEVKYVNDKGEKVPKKCPECGSDVKVFFKGEPVFICSNKECNKYFGTVPFNEEVGSLPPQRAPEAYIVPCQMGNSFSGYAYYDDQLDRPITIDDDGYLTPIGENYSTGTKMYYIGSDKEDKIKKVHQFIESGDYTKGFKAILEILMDRKILSCEEVILSESFKACDDSYNTELCKLIESYTVSGQFDALDKMNHSYDMQTYGAHANQVNAGIAGGQNLKISIGQHPGFDPLPDRHGMYGGQFSGMYTMRDFNKIFDENMEEDEDHD